MYSSKKIESFDEISVPHTLLDKRLINFSTIYSFDTTNLLYRSAQSSISSAPIDDWFEYNNWAELLCVWCVALHTVYCSTYHRFNFFMRISYLNFIVHLCHQQFLCSLQLNLSAPIKTLMEILFFHRQSIQPRKLYFGKIFLFRVFIWVYIVRNVIPSDNQDI